MCNRCDKAKQEFNNSETFAWEEYMKVLHTELKKLTKIKNMCRNIKVV